MTEIKFTATRTGRRAYRYEARQMRWFPIGVAKAELLIATGAGKDITAQAANHRSTLVRYR
ncbi:hypothetical protein [Georgenia thermotolerans]|uniref:hypothetical protein n=1 Tax=Georgenia thermotolerans TaxID=527326 RepID=UPI00126523BF|nr:hypothetical protein [Georgenia thermotolerans]